MEIIKTIKELALLLASYRQEGRQIAFVPTMGALHEGHLSLVRQAAGLGGITVCSIFVNPTQFNDPEDLKKYPRPLEQDIALLESVDCDVLFLPEVGEMYGVEKDSGAKENGWGAQEADWKIDLGTLDQVLEGKERPGHFRGVTQIVYKLFEAVKPDWAIFGQKDLQQFLVIQSMIDQKQLSVKLIMGETVREPEGLAMSSRNVRLSPLGRKQALVLFQTLREVKILIPEWVAGRISLQEIRKKAATRLQQAEGVRLEYFALCNRDTLLDADEDTPPEKLVALVAAWVDGVRLIDNVVL
ncbi:MAG TPA: pantoate--beta-alanine ligase [Sphingobacteriaceae bacterium]|nr:pantoate--beta-alanine ligase [Sphingobacteriaceae bacterium]